jgi:hypothetical protein
MCDTFWQTISAIVRRHYKDIKGRTDKMEEEASPLQYYSIKWMSLLKERPWIGTRKEKGEGDLDIRGEELSTMRH